MALGVVALWSNNEPRLTAFRIPPDGLDVGRVLFDPSVDDKISYLHARLRLLNDGIQIEDAGSRNGTYVGGLLLEEPGVFYPPEVMRCGRTVFLLVRDIERYEGRALTTRHRLTVGVSLVEPCRELDRAILAETSIAIIGPRWVGRTLARAYLAARNGGAEIDAKAVTEPLENVLAFGTSASRTVLLEAPNSLTPADLDTLATWLETDVRFVTCVRDVAELALLPAEIQRWLAPVTITIPEPRYDELPSAVHTAVLHGSPGIAVHATMIEALLLRAEVDEDKLLWMVGEELRAVNDRSEAALRGEGLMTRLSSQLHQARPRSLRDVHFLYRNPVTGH